MAGYIGAWRLVCETYVDETSGRTQADNIWNLLRNIHTEEPGLFPKPPKKIYAGSSTKIICFTQYEHVITRSSNTNCNKPEQKDVAGIRRAAEFIRNRIQFPFPIYYFEWNSADLKKQQLWFQHTPEGEMYKYTGHGIQIIPKNTSTSPKPYVNAHKHLLSRQPLNAALLPSEEFDSPNLYMPCTEEGIENMTSRKGGKWMVYSPGNSLANHDAAWTALLTLYRKGILVGLKASTSVLSPPDKYLVPGFPERDPVILCYTADSDDRDDVLRAVVAIRSVVDSDCVMFYKTNSASWNGDYYHEGKKSVTRYQHTVEGGLYEREEVLKRFKLIVPGKGNATLVDSSRSSRWW